MRKRKVLFLGRPYIMAAGLVFLMPLFHGTLFGQSPQRSSQDQPSPNQWRLAIEGPHEIPAGELVVLTATQIIDGDPSLTDETSFASHMLCDGDACYVVTRQDDATFSDVMSTEKTDVKTETPADSSRLQFRWQILPPELTVDTFRVCDDGRTFVFASRQVGCYHFVLAASDGEQLQMVTHTLVNVGEAPKPVPLPPPDLIPDPDNSRKPEPQNEFAPLYDWVAQKTGTLVRSDYFEREKAALVESLAEVTVRIRDDEIKTVERARVELRVLTRRKLEAVSRRSGTAWQAWETELARWLSQLEQDGKLETLEQLRAAFDTIADALLSEQTSNEQARPNITNGGT